MGKSLSEYMNQAQIDIAEPTDILKIKQSGPMYICTLQCAQNSLVRTSTQQPERGFAFHHGTVSKLTVLQL